MSSQSVLDLVNHTKMTNFTQRPSEVYPIVENPIVKIWFDNAIYKITLWVYQTKWNEKSNKEEYFNNIEKINFRTNNSEKKEKKILKGLYLKRYSSFL